MDAVVKRPGRVWKKPSKRGKKPSKKISGQRKRRTRRRRIRGRRGQAPVDAVVKGPKKGVKSLKFWKSLEDNFLSEKRRIASLQREKAL